MYVVLIKLAEKTHLKTAMTNGTGKFASGFWVYFILFFHAVQTLLSMFHHFYVFLYFFWSGKRKGKKKRDGLKDVAKDYRIPPAVLFLQCQIRLAEGLTMVIVF